MPFEAVTSDYCQVSGYHYLIIVDRFSNWPEIIKVNPGSSTSGATGLIKAFRRNFAIFGAPVELSSDGGPEFSAAGTEECVRCTVRCMVRFTLMYNEIYGSLQ